MNKSYIFGPNHFSGNIASTAMVNLELSSVVTKNISVNKHSLTNADSLAIKQIEHCNDP
jgi:hypothetical protein